jgi:uncharacterized protein involved in outer membrane biogenesis
MPHEDPQDDAPTPRHSIKRRLILIALLLLFIAALILTPPLINVDNLRHRIATSMSESLGRPVHLDSVTFHLLPQPGFTLTNLVVSEDPAFGNEPVIRAMDVEASLRVSSLWRHQVEFSTISFVPDANGSAPSINIVRNAEGRWNLQEILSQASHTKAAPTSQRKAGPVARFPYIEVSGARINLKLGDQKMPFSLTDVDFSLWLPSPQQWHIRLTGKPDRTDTNTSDTGSIGIEGTLGRAATLAAVPINLTASWAHAPTGEATRVLTGTDQQWRGNLDAGATLTGTVGNAQLTADIHLTDLRRADFVPSDLLDLSAHCTATTDLPTVTLTNATCTIPNGGPEPITIASTSLDLQRPAQSEATIDVHKLPLNWTLNWARLFSQHIPADLSAVGAINGTLTHANTNQPLPEPTPPTTNKTRHHAGKTSIAANAPTTFWSGNLIATLESAKSNGNKSDFTAKPILFDWQPTPAANPNSLLLQLQSVTIHPSRTTQLSLTSTIDTTQYTVQLTGTATPAQITSLGNAVLVPLGNELAATLKSKSSSPTAVNIQCVHPYNANQTCIDIPTTPQKPKSKHHHKR